MWFKISCLFIFISTFGYSQNNEQIIIWQDSIKLSWKNFKDKPDPNVDVVAITASGITFKYSIKKRDDVIIGFTTQVQTIFYPEKSWYKPERANAYILSHEQLHFDITELHSRKFRQQITSILVTENLVENLDLLHLQIQKDLKYMQNLYDSETDNSRIIEAQTKWQKIIHDQLSKYSNYKSLN
ncbi:hypothetical protein [Formosa maritima]|uniref:DUF922 domain-containing protein n=1 Tax=Formosa maritima TaxID=2592046 RepID=A0A5D0G922_9FLAO|nr:hypothetical protein [Formosa maritima]TYA54829.1 hypothetical protein FVF61_08645 [Formosa maritima]